MKGQGIDAEQAVGVLIKVDSGLCAGQHGCMRLETLGEARSPGDLSVKLKGVQLKLKVLKMCS